MQKVRLMGPRNELRGTLAILQDLELLHLTEPDVPDSDGLSGAGLPTRHGRSLEKALEDIEQCLRLFGVTKPEAISRDANVTISDLARWVKLARRTRRKLERLDEARTQREEELALIRRFETFVKTFEPFAREALRWPDGQPFYLMIRETYAGILDELRTALHEVAGDEFEMFSVPVGGGEIAVLLLTTNAVAEHVGALLAEANIEELAVPEPFARKSLADMATALRTRRDVLEHERDRDRRAVEALRANVLDELLHARASIHDHVRLEQARVKAARTPRAFVLEGWLPERRLDELRTALRSRAGAAVVLEVLARESWSAREAPVVLSNPRLFRPFELITRRLPLPRYGTMDPTPFVAIFFPMFFGVILGDVGYGVVLGLLALLIRWRARPGSVWRSVAEIAGAGAVFTVIFGLLYGELFGSLGADWFGLRALGLHRQEAVFGFLLFALALGVVHILLGILVGAIGAWRAGERRTSLGRGVSALMVVVIIIGLLAAFELLPRSLFTTSVIVLLIAFPVLILLEGISGVVELMSTLGNILSYARIMAVGTASVMLAVVANRIAGAVGGLLVGILIGLLFHLVNFAVGVFSPTIHALRLHYVEFFGKFYSPGGTEYEPLGHWRTPGAAAA